MPERRNDSELFDYESFKQYKRFWWALYVCVPLIYLVLTLLY